MLAGVVGHFLQGRAQAVRDGPREAGLDGGIREADQKVIPIGLGGCLLVFEDVELGLLGIGVPSMAFLPPGGSRAETRPDGEESLTERAGKDGRRERRQDGGIGDGVAEAPVLQKAGEGGFRQARDVSGADTAGAWHLLFEFETLPMT